MQLLTKELEARFLEVGSQESVEDPIVVATFFNPAGAGVWYATEYNPSRRMFFGYVSILEDGRHMWADFSLADLEEFYGDFGPAVTRDLYCGEFPVSQVLLSMSPLTCGCTG